MAFEPRNELERLFITGSQDSNALLAFYRGLLENDLYIIMVGDAPPTEHGVVTGSNTSIQTISLKFENRFVVPMFTSLERLSAVAHKPDAAYAAMNGRAMLTTFQGKEILLNPGADVSKLITPDEIAAILNGTTLRINNVTVPTGTTVRIWSPKQQPIHIISSLSQLFVHYKEIDAAYLVVMQFPNTSPDCWWTICVKTSGNSDALWKIAIKHLETTLKNEDRIQFFDLADLPTDMASQIFKTKVKPFYQRKNKWLGLF